jgi:hypothetical protein
VALDALGLCAVKLAIGSWVLGHGFTHVSDDDYARTVIAEQFAHTPRLDPSGTSWLPLPFWVEGGAMMVAGRSLEVARGVAVAWGALSCAAPYIAMRLTGVSRAVSVVAVAVAMALPWNAWLGVSMVPEGWAGALVAAGAIAMRHRATRPWAAAAMLVASLARYEAWPACAVMAGFCAWQAIRGKGGARDIGCALLVAAGPVAWMAWNAHVHGSPVHFLARVSAFRHAVGAAAVPRGDKLLDYPRALAHETPEAVALGVVGAAGAVALAGVRERWRWPALVGGTVLAFLVVGDVGDGAPTHHAARALSAVWWILIGMGVDSAVGWACCAAASRGARRGAVWCTAGAAAMAWCATLPSRWDASPGRSASERREAQIARGIDLRARGVRQAWIAPCSFEHFALIAAWGEPERAHVGERTGEETTGECPRVAER